MVGLMQCMMMIKQQLLMVGKMKPLLIKKKCQNIVSCPDGKIAWVMGQSIPEVNSENQIVGYVGTVTDITERKQAEDRIFKKDYSETIINNLPGIFYLYDESGKFLKWNENFELVTGYNSHEISQMTPLDLLRMRKKRSASELILSSKKNLRGLRLSYILRQKRKYTIISIR
jgi:PAS domain-containing protein